MSHEASQMIRSRPVGSDQLAHTIRASVARGERLELALVVIPYLAAIVVPVALVSCGWLHMVWGVAVAVLLSIGAGQAHAWLTGSLHLWLQPRLLRPARAQVHQWLAELGQHQALVHSWSDTGLGAVALTDEHLLVADRDTKFAPLAIGFADISRVQLLRGTSPKMIVIYHLNATRANSRQYLLFPETIIAELWHRELQTRLPQLAA